MKRTKFTPEQGKTYKNQGGGTFRCLRSGGFLGMRLPCKTWPAAGPSPPRAAASMKTAPSTGEERAEAAEVEAIRKAILTARGAIHDAKARYIKQRLRSKSKQKAAEDPFEELKDYESRQQIHDDYGWGFITEARMDRLMELWDAREESRKKNANAVYEDRVTRMLDTAWAAIGEEHVERLHAYDQKEKFRRQEAERIAKENNERTRLRELGQII